MTLSDPEGHAPISYLLYAFTRAGISCRRVSVSPSLCHKSVFYWNG